MFHFPGFFLSFSVFFLLSIETLFLELLSGEIETVEEREEGDGEEEGRNVDKVGQKDEPVGKEEQESFGECFPSILMLLSERKHCKTITESVKSQKKNSVCHRESRLHLFLIVSVVCIHNEISTYAPRKCQKEGRKPQQTKCPCLGLCVVVECYRDHVEKIPEHQNCKRVAEYVGEMVGIPTVVWSVKLFCHKMERKLQKEDKCLETRNSKRYEYCVVVNWPYLLFIYIFFVFEIFILKRKERKRWVGEYVSLFFNLIFHLNFFFPLHHIKKKWLLFNSFFLKQ